MKLQQDTQMHSATYCKKLNIAIPEIFMEGTFVTIMW